MTFALGVVCFWVGVVGISVTIARVERTCEPAGDFWLFVFLGLMSGGAYLCGRYMGGAP